MKNKSILLIAALIPLTIGLFMLSERHGEPKTYPDSLYYRTTPSAEKIVNYGDRDIIVQGNNIIENNVKITKDGERIELPNSSGSTVYNKKEDTLLNRIESIIRAKGGTIIKQ